MSNTTSTRKVINKLKKLQEYQNNIDQDFLSKSLEWIEKRAIKNLILILIVQQWNLVLVLKVK